MGLVADLVASPVLVRVETNNRLHIRYRLYEQQAAKTGLIYPSGDVMRTVDDGRCGIDDNWVEASFTALDNADPDRLCRYCFPPA